MVIDCTNIGIANLDLDLLRFIVTTFSQYYPKLFDSIIVHELPYLLTYVFKLVQSWLPEDDRKFFHLTTRKSLTNHIDKSQLPNFLLNGTNPARWDIVSKSSTVKILSATEFVTAAIAAPDTNNEKLKPDSADKLKFLYQYIQQ